MLGDAAVIIFKHGVQAIGKEWSVWNQVQGVVSHTIDAEKKYPRDIRIQISIPKQIDNVAASKDL